MLLLPHPQNQKVIRNEKENLYQKSICFLSCRLAFSTPHSPMVGNKAQRPLQILNLSFNGAKPDLSIPLPPVILGLITATPVCLGNYRCNTRLGGGVVCGASVSPGHRVQSPQLIQSLSPSRKQPCPRSVVLRNSPSWKQQFLMMPEFFTLLEGGSSFLLGSQYPRTLALKYISLLREVSFFLSYCKHDLAEQS